MKWSRIKKKHSAEWIREINSTISVSCAAQVKHCFAFESQLLRLLWRIPFAVHCLWWKGNADQTTSGPDMTLSHSAAEFLTGINLTHLRGMEAHSSLENEGRRMGATYTKESLPKQKPGCVSPSSKLASELPDTPSSPSKCEKRRNKTETIPQRFESFERPGYNLPHSNHRTILAAFTIAILPFPLRLSVVFWHKLGAAWGRGCLSFPIILHVTWSIMGYLTVLTLNWVFERESNYLMSLEPTFWSFSTPRSSWQEQWKRARAICSLLRFYYFCSPWDFWYQGNYLGFMK